MYKLPQAIFEAVNKAYEFLCSKMAKRTEGPDPHRIVLLLQTQSILFKRYADGTYVRMSRSRGFVCFVIVFRQLLSLIRARLLLLFPFLLVNGLHIHIWLFELAVQSHSLEDLCV